MSIHSGYQASLLKHGLTTTILQARYSRSTPKHFEIMSTATLLELKNIGCSKEKGQPIFSDISLTVDEGEVLVLQGRSGSG